MSGKNFVGKLFIANFIFGAMPVSGSMMHACLLCCLILLYTVNHKKGGSTFVIITLENLDGF